MEEASYRKLRVWQRSMDLVEEIYRLCDQLPSDEKYGLISQMRRSAVSIPSNIAEGKRRGSDRELLRYLRIAFGSGAELETQIEVCIRVGHIKVDASRSSILALEESMSMLNSLIGSIELQGVGKSNSQLANSNLQE